MHQIMLVLSNTVNRLKISLMLIQKIAESNRVKTHAAIQCTSFCIQFLIKLKSMRSQCSGQRKCLTVQLNSRPVRRIRFYAKIDSNDQNTLFFYFSLVWFAIRSAGRNFSTSSCPPGARPSLSILSALADHLGRRAVLLFSVTTSVLGSVINYFSPDVVAYIVLRCLTHGFVLVRCRAMMTSSGLAALIQDFQARGDANAKGGGTTYYLANLGTENLKT